MRGLFKGRGHGDRASFFLPRSQCVGISQFFYEPLPIFEDTKANYVQNTFITS